MRFKMTQKIMVLFLCVMLVGNVSFAAIKDVPADHWSKAFVETVVSRDIMPLYPDGSFKPDASVDTAEVLMAVYRTALKAGAVSEPEAASMTEKYRASIVAAGIPVSRAPYGTDLYPAVAFALEKGIVSADDLKDLAAVRPAKKIDAVVYVSKGLSALTKDDLSMIVALGYSDRGDIPISAFKYVHYMIQKGVIAKAGDANNRFNPGNPVSRAVLAALVGGMEKALSEHPGSGTGSGTGDQTPGAPAAPGSAGQPGTSQPSTSQGTVSGTVTAIDDAALKVTLKTAAGKVETYALEGAVIKAGAAGTEVGSEGITVGARITLTLKDGVVIEGKLDVLLERLEGKVSLMTGYLDESKTLRSLRVEPASGGFEFRRVLKDTAITLDGVPVTAQDLKVGYRVSVLYEGYDAKRIIAYSNHYTFYALLKNPIEPKVTKRLVGTLASGGQFVGDIDSKTAFVKADSGLKAGDIVKITLSYGDVSKVEYVGQARTFAGRISHIHIAKDSELGVDVAGGKTEAHLLSSAVRIRSDENAGRLSIYDLRLGQEVTVTVGIGGITEIQLGRKLSVEPAGIKVTVTQIISSSNILLATDASGKLRTLTFPTGSTYKASQYKVGEILNIEGKAIGEAVFEVEKVTPVSTK